MAIYTATDAETWSPPVTMFESVNSHGEENEPFAVMVAGHGHGHGLDPVPDVSQAGTFSCRSGTGAYEYEIPSHRTRRLTEGESENESGLSVRQCNWSRPVRTNLPDAPSRTCGGRLPSDQSGQGVAIGLIGTESGQHICNPNPSSCSRS